MPLQKSRQEITTVKMSAFFSNVPIIKFNELNQWWPSMSHGPCAAASPRES